MKQFFKARDVSKWIDETLLFQVEANVLLFVGMEIKTIKN